MRILTSALLLSSLTLVSCGGDDKPAATKPTPTAPAPIDNSMFDTTKPKTMPTFRVISAGLDARAADALAAGVLASAKTHHNSFTVLITPGGAEITDSAPVDAIILADGVPVPKFTSKGSSLTPIIVLSFSATPATAPSAAANRFVISTPVAEGETLPLAITPEILADIKSGKTPSVAIPDFTRLGFAAAEAARAVISGEGKSKIPLEPVDPLHVTKDNLTDPALKPLLP